MSYPCEYLLWLLILPLEYIHEGFYMIAALDLAALTLSSKLYRENRRDMTEDKTF